MTKTIRVRYSGGNLQPLEPLAMEEGAEMTAILACPEPPTGGASEGPPMSRRAGTELDQHPGRIGPGSPTEKPQRTMGTDTILIAEDFDAPLTPEEEELFGL